MPNIRPLVDAVKIIGANYFHIAVEDAVVFHLLNNVLWGQQNHLWFAHRDGIVTTNEVALGISFHVHNFFVALLGSEPALSQEELGKIEREISVAFSKMEKSAHPSPK